MINLKRKYILKQNNIMMRESKVIQERDKDIKRIQMEEDYNLYHMIQQCPMLEI